MTFCIARENCTANSPCRYHYLTDVLISCIVIHMLTRRKLCNKTTVGYLTCNTMISTWRRLLSAQKKYSKMLVGQWLQLQCGKESDTLYFLFFLWGETESSGYCGHCLAYCTSPRWWLWYNQRNVNWQGNQITWRKSSPVPLCPQQIPHDLTQVWTRAATMGSRRLTTWAMAWL
jgi:hypothetical protein